MEHIHIMDEKKLDLNLLQVFEALMEDSHLTRAGFRLGLSQPAMSHALGKLRRLTGDPLFVKVPKGMMPTELALRMAPSVRSGLELLRAAIEGGQGFEPARCDRTFQILMSDIGEVVYLPRLMNRLKAEAPAANLRVLQLPREAYQEVLASGEADLAIGFLPALKTGVYQQRLFEDGYIGLVSADHPRIGRKLTLRQFQSEDHVLIEPAGSKYIGSGAQTSTSTLFERSLADQGVTRRVALRVPHFMVVPTIVQQTEMIACLPRYAMEYTKRVPRLKMLNLPFEAPSFEVRQFWHERKHNDEANRWLRAMVASLFMQR